MILKIVLHCSLWFWSRKGSLKSSCKPAHLLISSFVSASFLPAHSYSNKLQKHCRARSGNWPWADWESKVCKHSASEAGVHSLLLGAHCLAPCPSCRSCQHFPTLICGYVIILTDSLVRHVTWWSRCLVSHIPEKAAPLSVACVQAELVKDKSGRIKKSPFNHLKFLKCLLHEKQEQEVIKVCGCWLWVNTEVRSYCFLLV